MHRIEDAITKFKQFDGKIQGQRSRTKGKFDELRTNPKFKSLLNKPNEEFISYDHFTMLFSEKPYEFARELAQTCDAIVEELNRNNSPTHEGLQELREKGPQQPFEIL